MRELVRAASSNYARMPGWDQRPHRHLRGRLRPDARVYHFGAYVREETLSVDLVQLHPDQAMWCRKTCRR